MENSFTEVSRFESIFVQAWLCSACGEAVGHYESNEVGQRYLLPLANCCPSCGSGPQGFELVSGRWRHVIEHRRRPFSRRFEQRVRVLGFTRTGLEQQMSDYTASYLE